MNFKIELKPRAIKDLRSLPKADQRRVVTKIELLQNDLAGDIKKLTNYSHEYRLRVGNYRVLFEVAGSVVIIYRVIDRKDAYKSIH